MKKSVALLLVFALLMSFTMVGCGSKPSAPAPAPAPAPKAEPQKFVLKFGNVYAPDHPFNTGFKELAETLKKKSDGRIELQVYPASQLGNENDLADAVSQNMVEDRKSVV